MEPEPRVLSIQSHVVHGYVGNKSATFPLQLLGFEVDGINTVQFSNHSAYKYFKGPILANSDLEDLIEGLTLNKIDSYTHVLTGYSRDPDSLLQVVKIIAELRNKNPGLIYVCDPVMGDEGHMYVPEAMLPVYRDRVVPLSDILTPNQFEAELLTNTKIKNFDDAWNAINILHQKGVKTVLISSSELGDENTMIGLASTSEGKRFVIQIPKFPVHFTGTGDLFAALILAWSHKSKDNIQFALENTIATLQNILQDTYKTAYEKYGSVGLTTPNIELRLIQNKSAIENPKITLLATKIE